MAAGTIYLIGYEHPYDQLDKAKEVSRGCLGSTNVSADYHVMWTAREFRYAAQRQNSLLVVDFVPRWKGFLLKLIGVKVHAS